ncbi:MAG: TIGR04283 family arsenosugar biosynthesis glycosyltransferase, partial [Candidatus Omnitrophica bacterium]|nr:TIGR04283 family arsenosugar biosynthesis glycosyltransferase [Candidatus Omnitrophota bacterium]
PAYNEEKTIHSTLEDLFTKQAPEEVIVVDGGSIDQTAAIARKWTTVLESRKGRALQMNVGARHATGDIFLFLHADTRLPEHGLEKIMREINNGSEAGRFRMCFDDRSWLLKMYESYTRFHFFSYGDQGFFVKRNVFETLAGFDESAPFEDIDFYKRLQQITNPVILRDSVITSARRFCGVGCLKQKIINIVLVSLYYAGINVFSLKEKLYQEIR